MVTFLKGMHKGRFRVNSLMRVWSAIVLTSDVTDQAESVKTTLEEPVAMLNGSLCVMLVASLSIWFRLRGTGHRKVTDSNGNSNENQRTVTCIFIL